MTYKDNLLRHLVRYKEKVLGIRDSGTWLRRGKKTEVGHILPEGAARENLLAPFRAECWRYVTNRSRGIKLHQYFHHLNSSQAMCFNLFFPFMASKAKAMPILLEALELPRSSVSPVFEKVFDANENTNFDFCLELQQAPLALFELKLSEDGFGEAKATDLEKYARKLQRFHHQPLSQYVDRSWLELGTFMPRYQVMRNVSYACQFPSTTLFFVVPRANEALRTAIEELPGICGNKLKDRVRVFYLEELVSRFDVLSAGDPTLSTHWQHFRQKYLFGSIDG